MYTGVKLLRAPGPVVVTIRRPQDGGKFEGSEELRQMLLRTAIADGVEYVDLEEIDTGIWNLYFGPLKLGRLDERQMRIEDAFRRLKRHQARTITRESPTALRPVGDSRPNA